MLLRRFVASKAAAASKASGKSAAVTANVWVNKDTKVICQGITGANVVDLERQIDKNQKKL
jgi:hypothetical protein